MPAVFNVGAGDALGLIAAIRTADSNGQSNVINLTAGAYDLTAVNNFWYGPDGLPTISSNLTINGNGATIQRDSSAPNFRLFYVSGGFDGLPAGSLTLNNLTLAGGVAQGGSSNSGGGGLGAGGAIFNQGTLSLTGVTLTNNQAVGGNGDVLGSEGSGGGGMGENATGRNGGGFGGSLGGSFGSDGPSGSASGGGSGGGGFRPAPADDGQAGMGSTGGSGGGLGGFGGSSAGTSGGRGGDGGGGSNNISGFSGIGGAGGDFGEGGFSWPFPPSGPGNGVGFGAGGGGVGGGGGSGSLGGGGGFGGGGGTGGGGGGFGGGGGGSGLGGVGGFGGGGGGNPGGGGGGGMGGAVFNMFGSATFTNCTLADNTAQGGNSHAIGGFGGGGGGGSGFGGAVFNLDGQLSLTFCTLADNTVTAGVGTLGNGNAAGGAVYNLAFGNNINTGGPQSATATIVNSILSNSVAGVDLVNNTDTSKNPGNIAAVTLSGPNLVMSSTGTIGGSAPLTADPQLGPLQNNGGPTPTMAIPFSSPAFDAGMPVAGITTDQRGVMRPAAPALGAFQPSPVATTIQLTNLNITPNRSNLTALVSLTAQVNNPAGTVNEGLVTFTLAGMSVQGTVQNGTANAQAVIPLRNVATPMNLTVSYADNGMPPLFGPGNTVTSVALNLLNALLPSVVTLTPDGGEQNLLSFPFTPLVFLYLNQQFSAFHFGPLVIELQRTFFGSILLVTFNGQPLQAWLFGAQGQLLGSLP